LIEALRQEGIASEIYYPLGLHQQPALTAYAPLEALPEAERASRETLALPLFPELRLDRVERVVGAVSRFLAS
jgi:dTDP-4-amino-4,6-dideoxygalactose transaminase